MMIVALDVMAIVQILVQIVGINILIVIMIVLVIVVSELVLVRCCHSYNYTIAVILSVCL